MAENVFIELSIIILIAIGFAALMRLLRQPLIIGYILTGIVVSPYFLGLFRSSEDITTFGQVGVALLLFMGAIGQYEINIIKSTFLKVSTDTKEK